MAEIYLVMSFIFLGVLAAYYLKGGMTLGTCAGWVILTCIHGLVFKPLFVYFDFPSAELLDIVLFKNITRSEYWGWAWLALLGYVMFFASMAYAGQYRTPPPRVETERRSHYFSNPGLLLFLVPMLAGVIGFFMQFPQLLLGSASKNAIASLDLEEYNGGGPWRVLVEFGYLVSLCALVNVGARVQRRLSLAIFTISAGPWLVFCYLSDQRGSLMFSIITYMIAYNRFVGKLSPMTVAVAGITTVGLVVARTVARLQGGGAALADSLGSTLSNFVGQNFIEHGKTISIIKAVPHVLDYQYGFTYLNALLVLVPRSLFPDKTSVNLDTTIGNKVFGCDAFGACGVPPGLLAESYLNFGAIGLLVMPVLAGLFIGRVDAKFRNAPRGSAFDIFFLVSLLYLGMAFLGSGLSSSITSIATQCLSIGVLCLICARSTNKRWRWVVSSNVRYA